ncbi:rRNA-processing protein [Saccharomycopsis crataegensis]|uniref:U3 small nucleolar ribonucleoprotein protein MPP10 n=1 Tax=Saccharomycopsis crataegensis TaxID=43959 RepID=A0AAV5QGH2_9ASCO|nr:rRNA-processing protein [Saccharomycopsis crataegensis]
MSGSGSIEIILKNPTDVISQILQDQSADGASNKFSQTIKSILDPVITLKQTRTKKNPVLDQIYIEGLDSNQVWEQAKLVIDDNIEELMFEDIPELKSRMGNVGGAAELIEEDISASEEELSADEEQVEAEKTVYSDDDDYEDYRKPEARQYTDLDDELSNEIGVEEDNEEDNEEDQEHNNEDDGFGLNDGFFALENYKKQVLELEDKDDMLSDGEEEIDYFGEISDGSDDEVDYYDDFFNKPTSDKSKPDQKTKESAKSKHNDDDDEEDDEEADFGEDEYKAAMNHAMLDLFADEEEAQSKSKNGDEGLSTFEKQQKQIQKQIAELEKEAVEEKKWTMKGEASVKNRPTDALLDEELEFDRNAKPVPIITKEVTESIEDLIRRRIQNYEFDDLPRRLFSDMENDKFKSTPQVDMDEMGKKSQKSLAEIYEDEHYNGVTADSVKNDELEAKHEEIIALYQSVTYKLDALCSAHYIPAPAGKSLEIKVNTSTITMEDAQPLIMNSESTLAPQEVFKAQSGVNKETNEVRLANGMIVNKDELTKEEKKNMRQKNKRKLHKQNEAAAIKKKSKKSKKEDVMDTLKKANVQVISKKGVKTDIRGNIIKEGGKSKSVGFKL